MLSCVTECSHGSGVSSNTPLASQTPWNAAPIMLASAQLLGFAFMSMLDQLYGWDHGTLCIVQSRESDVTYCPTHAFDDASGS